MTARVSAGCHAGGNDPIDAAPARVGRITAAAIVNNLQKAVRLGSTDPNAAVLTAGPLWAGDALNVIPDQPRNV